MEYTVSFKIFIQLLQLNIKLDSLCKWFKSKKLSLTTEKTFYMNFHRAKLKFADGMNVNVIMDNLTLKKSATLLLLSLELRTQNSKLYLT